MATQPAPPIPDKIAREVRRILILVALVGLVLAGAVTVALSYLYRLHRFQVRVMDSIEEVSAEPDERAAFEVAVRERLFAGAFDELDRMARELRASRETYSNGVWKLTKLYDGLGSRGRTGPELDLEAAIEQANAWTRKRPDSITARLVLAELWMSHAWAARAGKWDHDLTDEERALVAERLQNAQDTLHEADEVEEECPHQTATELRLAVAGRWPKEEESRVYEWAIREEPDYQPLHDLHLYYLEPTWMGGYGDWARAAGAIAAQPGGPERYARAVWWQRRVRGNARFDDVSWPLLKRGFQGLVARHPDSFEVKSAFCYFAAEFKDLPETRRLLDEIGYRMQTSVWRDRKRFASAHRWAEFEDSERSGDPIARFLVRLMPSR
jgi:hypothetical protein